MRPLSSVAVLKFMDKMFKITNFTQKSPLSAISVLRLGSPPRTVTAVNVKKSGDFWGAPNGTKFEIFKHTLSTGGANEEVPDFVTRWTKILDEHGVSEPRDSVEYIVMHCLGLELRSQLYSCSRFVAPHQQQLQEMLRRRLARVPVQYILGNWDFRTLNLNLRPPVFIPRPETEQLVDLVSAEIDSRLLSHSGDGSHVNVLELCCGSGAIALSLLQEKPNNRVNVTAVDALKEAVDLTLENARKHKLEERLRVVHGKVEDLDLGRLGPNYDNKIKPKYEIIVSNPPYVPTGELAGLQPEITRYESRSALDGGGQDGANFIRMILRKTSSILSESRGKLYLETDSRHPEIIRDYLIKNRGLRLRVNRVYRDFCGKDRFIEIVTT